MAERNREKIQVSSILVGLASPDEILSWSHGEVTKSETINYRTQKPEPDGLFCEKIFGPSKDYSCWCGKYKKAKDEGSICDKCGVEITTRAVRRERMGHIKLNVPCTHIWYLKGIPSRIALVLDVPPKQLESVVYFNGHFMIDPGTSVSLNNISRPEHENKEHKYKNKIIYIDSSPVCREIMKNALVDVKNKIIEDGRQNEYDLSLVEDYIEHINDVQTFRYLDYVNIIGKYLGAKFGEGSEVVELLLKTTDLVAESQAIREELADASEQKAKKLIKRLECLESFIFSGNKPEWMILRILPVIPPDLRPLLPLDGGRFASTDVNELYRTIINRNNMLKRLKDQNAPRLMITSACRTLQEAVDALIDNGRRNGKPVTAGGGRPLKSLSGALKGKQGRFRQNLLGKRVDYSGRSVIAVGPSLKMFECGLPREMAIKLLRPFLVKELLDKNIYSSATQCDNAIDRQEGQVFDALDKIISRHPVLLNRAPTLHRLGIQAFKPVLVEGRAIRLHPLVCPGFNADFDGDQMAVHVPITKEAQEEALNIMLASRNILGPKDGKPICIPSQDMVLGNYYLTREESKEDFLKRAEKAHEIGDYQEEEAYKMYAAAEGKVFSGYNEIKLAYDSGKVHLHNRIAVRGRDLNKTDFTEEMKDSYLITTVGKVIFNNELPDDFPFINNPDKKSNLARTLPEFFVPKGTNIKEYIASKELIKPIKKKFIGLIIDEAFQRYKSEKTSVIVDAIKDLGFLYSTKYGLTISIADIKLSAHRDEIIKETEEKIEEINRNYDKGLLSNNERYQATINEWGDKEGLNSAKKKIEQDVKAELESDKNNPLYVLSDSGARGSLSNFAQLMGMRGLMANTKGVTIEIPVKSCFRQGLSTSEFFTGTHGARKGGADTALKTADSGYLTRRLVDVSHDVIVKEEDCGSDKGSVIRTIYEDSTQGKAIATLEDRAVGRYALEDIIDPQSGEIIVNANSLITDQDARNIKNAGITEIKIRSVFGCKAKDGVCVHCYGKSLATGNVVEVGQAVGVMAAQSIGEPGTQLTMRTFHTGGVAGGDITQGLPRVAELFEARTPKGQATITTIPGIVEKIEQSNQVYSITVYNDELDERETYLTNVNSKVIVKEGMRVESGQKLTAGNISLRDLLACTGPDYVENYIVEEIHKVYQPNGIFISDKHIEIIVRKMMSKIDVISSGDTNLLSGRKVSINEFTRANGKALIEGKRPAVGVPSILGITKAALSSDSFLSAASFQQTTSVLTDAAIKGKRDYFHGLKENVIGGKLIPAGRGLLSESEEKEIMDNFDVVDSINKIHKDYGLPLIEKDEPEEEPEDSIDSLRQNSELELED